MGGIEGEEGSENMLIKSEKTEQEIEVTRLVQLNAINVFNNLICRRSRGKVTEIQRSTFSFFRGRCDALIRAKQTPFLCGVENDVFHTVLDCIRQRNDGKVPTYLRLVIFLKFAKLGISENALAREIGLGQCTVSRIVSETIKDLVKVAQEYIHWPHSPSEVINIEQHFLQKSPFRCFGVLDGKHWRCQHPPHSGSLNRNYKKFFSFNSLVVADREGRIIYLQLSKLGINCDAQLFRKGRLPGLLEEAQQQLGFRALPGSRIVAPPFLIADNGFGLSKSIITPYRLFALTSENMEFNRLLSSTRVKIENVFGMLHKRFQVFERALMLSPQNARGLIVSLAVIHNISKGPRPQYPVPRDVKVVDPYATVEDQRTALKHFVLKL